MATLPYRPAIDGLRAVAVASVVLYHAGFGPPTGFAGVDVFFVISGYLMTALLIGEQVATGRIDLFVFYARRLRRLYPALVTVVACTAIASTFIVSPYGPLTDTLRSAGASLVFGANVFFEFTTGGYFDPKADRLPLLHLWSLGVEEQFYLAWPLCLIATACMARRVLRAAFIAALLGSLVFAEIYIYLGSQAAFFSVVSRWWELGLGATVAWVPLPKRAAAGAMSIGLAIVAASMGLTPAHFPGSGALMATVGSALVIAAAVSGGTTGLCGRILSSMPAVGLGRISYSLYLWHWPLLVLAATAHAGGVQPAIRAGIVLISLGLAALTYRYVETPFRGDRQGPSSRQVVGAGVLGSVSTALLLVSLANAAYQYPPRTDPASMAEGDQPTNRLTCHSRGDQDVTLPPASECAVGKGPVRVAIWGDSHALAWQPIAWAIAQRDHASAVNYTRDACAPALTYNNGKRLLEASRCEAFNKAVIERLAGLDTVVLAAWWPDPDVRNFENDFSETLTRITHSVRHVVIVGQTPALRESVPVCIAKNDLGPCMLPTKDFLEGSSAVREMLKTLASHYPNVEYVEPEGFYCNATSCPPLKDGLPLYWDTNHVATRAATAFARAYVGRRVPPMTGQQMQVSSDISGSGHATAAQNVPTPK